MPLAIPIRRMPYADTIRTFMTDLLGREVKAGDAPELDLKDPNAGLYSGVLLDDDDRIDGLIVADLEFASFSGASLVMIPKASAEKSIAAGSVDENLRENFQEVVNVMTGLLNGPIHPHLRLRDVVEGVPDEVGDFLLRAAGRRSFKLNIEDYGTGRVSLYAD